MHPNDHVPSDKGSARNAKAFAAGTSTRAVTQCAKSGYRLMRLSRRIELASLQSAGIKKTAESFGALGRCFRCTNPEVRAGVP
jgi:hypothetical protein